MGRNKEDFTNDVGLDVGKAMRRRLIVWGRAQKNLITIIG